VGTLDTVQQEQLRAIGNYLSQVRQEQERSLEDIAAKTYIPLRLLKAIEAGQEQPLPEPVFIQGFIRRYADALGLDGTDLSQKFPVHVTPLPMVATVASGREARLNSAGESTYVHSAPIEDELPRQSRSSRRSTDFLPYIAAAALLAFGGITLGIVRAISSRQPNGPTQSAVVLPEQPPVNEPSESPAPSPITELPKESPKASPTAESSGRAASPSPTATPNSVTSSSSASTSSSSSTAANTSNAPVNVKLSLTDESWVQVVVDGEVKAEAVLPKGTQQTWSGQRQITVLAGNAGAVSVSHNGGAAQKMGALGDVSERTFAPKPSGSSNSSPN
jgi:cytoskeletal protein RodZ